MSYVDGYLLKVPADRLEDYRKMAEKGSETWMKHGALDYKECVSDDINPNFGRPFTQIMEAESTDVIIFAYVVFKSREHRDEVNAKVMSDPAMTECGDPNNMPFDCTQMVYGGFKTIVE